MTRVKQAVSRCFLCDKTNFCALNRTEKNKTDKPSHTFRRFFEMRTRNTSSVGHGQLCLLIADCDLSKYKSNINPCKLNRNFKKSMVLSNSI